MGWYYNKGRGNLPLSLSGQNSISIPGNSWAELKGADETTPSVMRAKAKGLIHRQDAPPKHLRPAPAPKADPKEAPAEEAAPEKTPPVEASKPKTEAKKEEVKTPDTGDEAGAPAAPEPKPSTAGKSKKTSSRKTK